MKIINYKVGKVIIIKHNYIYLMVFYIVACHKKDARSTDDIKATAKRALSATNGRELGQLYDI